jgi:hypothetical protein
MYTDSCLLILLMQITCLNHKDFGGNSRNCKGISAPKPSVQRYLGVLLVKKGKIDIVISRFCCTESGSTLPDKVVLYQIVGTLLKSLV